MANQITIDIGAAANDGTGDPLRTAFNYVNNNFSNVWNTGLPNSNVQFSDNRILTVNTNANLVLAPNGIGKVASNVDIVPNTANVFSLGGTARRWNTVYGQYLDLSHNATIGGNLVVTGNLTAGNISYTSNVFVGDLEGSVFDGASSIVLDVIDSAIYVDNYYYANGVPFSGGGSNYGNSNVAAYLPTYSGNINAANISAGNVFVVSTVTSDEAYITTGTFSGDQYGDDSLYIGVTSFTNLGSDVVAQIAGNAGGYSQVNFQNISNASTASSDYIITADNGNDSTHFIDLGMTSSTWDGSQTNVLTGLVPNNGYLYVQDGNLTLGTRNGNTSYSWNFDTTGNLTAPNTITANNLSATSNDGTGRNIKVGDDTYLGDINISNTLSIRGQQDGANAYIIFGNASNVKLGRAGTGPLTYEGDFTAQGNITANNNFQLPVYANATVRDSSITSPSAGMMIYVTGTGMQVRGATSWNTIAGSGT